MILTIATILLIVLGSLYMSEILMLIVGLHRLRPGENPETPYVSIIVAARNEEHTIGPCLSALTAQTYPQEKYEIIVVDDESVDHTLDRTKNWTEQFKNIQVLRVDPETSSLIGKKRALDLGIQRSTGEIILTTDADCMPRTTWIQGMLAYFEPDVGLVAGYSYTEEPEEKVSVLQKLRSLERIAVAAVAAGSIGLGKGMTCTGQNVAYRKKAYTDVGGFTKIGHLRSGDDDLLIQLIDRNTSWNIRYATTPETYVLTKPPIESRQYLEQEKRRASKGLFYPPWLIILLLFLLAFYTILLLSLCFSFFDWNHFSLAWLVLALKIIIDFFLLLKICTMLNRRDLLIFFPVAEVLHIPYVLVFGVWGTLGKYTWK